MIHLKPLISPFRRYCHTTKTVLYKTTLMIDPQFYYPVRLLNFTIFSLKLTALAVIFVDLSPTMVQHLSQITEIPLRRELHFCSSTSGHLYTKCFDVNKKLVSFRKQFKNIYKYSRDLQ